MLILAKGALAMENAKKSRNKNTWGPMLDEYYKMTRTALNGEIDFWLSKTDPKMRVLEIGAGQGFLSQQLLSARPKSLTLVEPLVNCQRYLESLKSMSDQTNVEIYDRNFEHIPVEKSYDLIIFAYDSLPMVPKSQLNTFFSQISRVLSPDGHFIFHISTPEWNQNYISQFRKVYHGNKKFPSGKGVKIFSWAEPLAEDYYEKHFVFVDEMSLSSEYYCMPVQILYHGYIERLCEDSGLVISSLSRSFDDGEGSDDLIYTVRKRRV